MVISLMLITHGDFPFPVYQGDFPIARYQKLILHLGVTMLVFYKNWQGIGESPVRNEFHREASPERWNGHSWQGCQFLSNINVVSLF